MASFRKVSADNMHDALEVQISGVVNNGDGTFGLTVGDVSTWSTLCDFITYARAEDGNVDESTRIVWTGEKINDTFINASKTGGSATYNPDSTNYAAAVPTHRWANDIVDALNLSLADDGASGIKSLNADPILFAIGSSQPAAVAGRTIVWFKPI